MRSSDHGAAWGDLPGVAGWGEVPGVAGWGEAPGGHSGPPPRRRRGGRLTLLVAVLLMISGVAAGAFVLLRPSGPPQPERKSVTLGRPAHVADPVGPSVPATVSISSLGVSAPVQGLSLTPTGELADLPLSPANLTGWYQNGPSPGERGPAVVVGHVDSHQGPSVFYKLGGIKKDAEIEVSRQDGKRAVYKVDATERVPKNAFPSEKVYGDLDYAAIRLVTCGGQFDQAKRSYTDNVIVYGHLSAVR